MAREKLNKVLSYALITSMLIGEDKEVENIELDSAKTKKISKLNNGVYEVKNKTFYGEKENLTGENMARNSIKEISHLIINNNETIMKIFLNESLAILMSEFQVSIDGKEIPFEEDKKEKSLFFKVPSLDTRIKLTLFVKMMWRKVDMFLENDLTTLVVSENK